MIRRLLVDHYASITLLVLLTVTVLSLYPLQQLPEIPGKDKTLHLLAYAALAFPVSFVKPKYCLWVLFSFLLWSGLIELIQPYVNRYGEWLDLLANGTGLALGFICGRIAAQFLPDNETR